MNKIIIGLSAMLLAMTVTGDAVASTSPTTDSTSSDAALVQQGQKLYKAMNCSSCHSTDGSHRVGPTFKGVYGSEVELNNGKTVTADEEYLKQSIKNPADQIVKGYPGLMPASYSNMSDQALNALVAFIKSLSDNAEGQGTQGRGG